MLRDRSRSGAQRPAAVAQAAALLILPHALDTERTTGTAPGAIVRAAPEEPEETQ